MEKYRIVIADDDREMVEAIKIILKPQGYELLPVYDGASALKKVQDEKPDLALLDYKMPSMDGYEVCRALKSNDSTRYIPVIILSGVRTKVYDKIIGLEAGADDYMVKPFDCDELRARIVRAIQRTHEIISLNPLTKLPGSTRIEEEVTKRLRTRDKFAVGYVDLDHFKAYNDNYGYKKGDNIINLLHDIIQEGIDAHGTKDDFIGHIGGDDFIVVTVPEKIEGICEYITTNFDAKIPGYYSEEDKTRGYIMTDNRHGDKTSFPIMTVSIGISTNEHRDILYYAEIIDILIEMKKYAKSLEQRNGSVFARDRRISKIQTFS